MSKRWRLVLGKYAADRLPHVCDEQCQGPQGCLQLDREAALDYLYDREYGGRGTRDDAEDGAASDSDPDATLAAGDGPSAPYVVEWLGTVRELFPADVVQVIEGHALDRYGLTELVNDPQVLAKLTPNLGLATTLLSLRTTVSPAVMGQVRGIIAQVVAELQLKLEPEVRRTLTGRLTRHRHSPMAAAHAFDPRGTIAANLKHLDPDSRALVISKPLFFERNTRRLPWQIVLVIDQSLSMASSVIHAAVLAGILCRVEAYSLKLVAFDTEVVDLTEVASDPVETLLTVQLGGGTDIAKAMAYASSLIDNPTRTVVVLISDMCEGGSVSALLATVQALAQARVTLIGLAALDERSHPFYDRNTAQLLADAGMSVAALSPAKLAEWLAEVTAK